MNGPNPGSARASASVPAAGSLPAAPFSPGGAGAGQPAVTAILLGPGTRRVRLAQVVCWQVAALLVVVGFGGGPVLLGVMIVAALALVAPTALPWRGYWLYQWLARQVAFRCRRRLFTAPVPGAGRPADDPRRALLEFVTPGAALVEASFDDDELAGLLAHPAGLTAVLEIQADERTLYATGHLALPALLSLLPAGENDPLPATMQILVHAEPATLAAGLPAESYRALTEGRVPAMRRCWLAVQVPRTPDFFDDDKLEPVLLNAVRRVRRRLRKEGLASAVLGPPDVLAVTALTARLPVLPAGDGGVYGSATQGAMLGPELGRELWDGWLSGGLVHRSYRVVRWPTGPRAAPAPAGGVSGPAGASGPVPSGGAAGAAGSGGAAGWSIDDAVLGLPASAVTASLAVVRDHARVRAREVGVVAVVRVTSATPLAAREAGRVLIAQVEAAGGAIERVDGRHRAGLGATLPLGWAPQLSDDRRSGRAVPPAALAATMGGGGLMIGRDRRREPVVVRLFRPEPTRFAFVGGLVAAQLLVLRMIAVGAQVMIQTARPADWARFVQQTGVGPEHFAFVASGDRPGPPGRAARPEVLVVDVGQVGWQQVDRGGNGRAVMIVRHELVPADRELLAGADVVVCQPLTEAEAAVAAPGVGAAESEEWLSRISAPMVAVVNRGVVRWATVNPTELELKTLGDPRRP